MQLLSVVFESSFVIPISEASRRSTTRMICESMLYKCRSLLQAVQP